jgi:hypothetical protein
MEKAKVKFYNWDVVELKTGLLSRFMWSYDVRMNEKTASIKGVEGERLVILLLRKSGVADQPQQERFKKVLYHNISIVGHKTFFVYF